MDPKIQKAFEVANYMSTLATQKQVLKEEYYQNLIHYYNGGTFKATRELINFIETLLSRGHDTDVVLMDDNDLPIEVSDLKLFSEDILSKYFEAINRFYHRYSNLKKSKSIERMIDL